MIGISIAGFDPSGGAGVLSDVKTFASLDIHGTSVITALTAQNSGKFFSLFPVSTSFIAEQFDAVLNEFESKISYGKTGMLYSKEIVETVSKKLEEYNIDYVVDPVMIASSGGKLSQEDIVKTLKKLLLKNSSLVTPNIKEAEALSNIKISNVNDAIEASIEISKYCNVLITGGHLDGINILNIDENVDIIQNKLITTNNTHGSGCCLSAAITSYLIKGNDLKIAIEKANKYVKLAIENGWYGTLRQ